LPLLRARLEHPAPDQPTVHVDREETSALGSHQTVWKLQPWRYGVRSIFPTGRRHRVLPSVVCQHPRADSLFSSSGETALRKAPTQHASFGLYSGISHSFPPECSNPRDDHGVTTRRRRHYLQPEQSRRLRTNCEPPSLWLLHKKLPSEDCVTPYSAPQDIEKRQL